MSSDPESAVREFLDAVPSARRRAESETLIEMMGRITGQSPRLWYTSIIGFGQYHYKYESGREGDAGGAGFSPRKAAMTVYLPDGIAAHTEALSRLGKHTTGVVCVYITDLSKVDLAVLEEIVAKSYATVTAGTWEFRAEKTATTKSSST